MFSFVSLSFFIIFCFDFCLFFRKCFCFFSLFYFFFACLRNFVEVLILLSCCFYAPRRGDLVRSAAKSSAFSVIYFAARERERERETVTETERQREKTKGKRRTKEDLLIEIIR